jgi:hypothetical protein
MIHHGEPLPLTETTAHLEQGPGEFTLAWLAEQMTDIVPIETSPKLLIRSCRHLLSEMSGKQRKLAEA